MTGALPRTRALREELLDQLLRASAAVALAPTVAGALLAAYFGLWPVTLLDVGGWLVLAWLALYRHMPYPLRASLTIALYALIGAGLLALLGPFGVGLVWLLGAPALAAVLLGQRTFWITEGVVLSVVLGVAGLAMGGVLSWPGPEAPLGWWLMAALSVVCVSLLGGLSGRWLLTQLELALARSVEANEVLQREIVTRKQAEAEREALQGQVAFAQKMELVGRLAGGLAHDLNNLLTVVQVEGTLARDAAAEDPEATEALDNLLEATGEASAVCGRLLHFARPGWGRRVELPVDAQLDALRPLMKGLAGDRIAVEADLAAPDATVVVDPSELEQIVTNLVANARDAMPDGGTIRVATRQVVDDSGPGVLISVADDGTGMDEATARHAFEPFFTTKAGRGSGLGLATVYSLVHSLDGDIRVRTRPGYGSRFTVQLPLARSAAAPPLELPSSRLRLPRAGTTVLVVDDNPAVRNVAVRVLEALGCVVSAEPDANAARERIESLPRPPDLLLTDVLMPGPTGADLAGLVRQRWPHTAILAMTGWLGSGEVAVRLEDLGVPVLRKPFTPAELVERVAELLVDEAASA